MQTREETIEKPQGLSSVNTLDPMDYPTPGASLTSDPKNAAYESPAQITDPAKAVDEVIASFETPETKKELMSAIASGFPVEAIVNSMAIGGVAEGRFSPDVAEIIKPIVALYLIKTALELGVPVIPFTDEVMDEESMDKKLEEETMSSMEQLAPERARFAKGKQAMEELKQKAIDADQVMQARNKIRQKEEEMPTVESDGTFLEMEGV
jgi:hypothetical protein|tara:strand:- start:6346 stop:6972 length:627 start_codon:yes stop_codon:yes gene_type:complete